MQPLESTVGGSTPDGDSIAINFNSGGKDGVSHRAKDDLKINATVVADLGPLNSDFSVLLIIKIESSIVCQFIICLIMKGWVRQKEHLT